MKCTKLEFGKKGLQSYPHFLLFPPCLDPHVLPLTYAHSYTANFCSISHLLGTVTTQDIDGVVTVHNCQKHSDYTVGQLCSHCTACIYRWWLCTITVLSLFSHCVVDDWWNRSFTVLFINFKLLFDFVRSCWIR